ncbi:hypothetical protein H7J07_02985 [Mycobacterium koreense]|uniref:Uncharacterized protein n=1 Tax=Mycolicibacillus koreensis TaxID=1069220 RepID=A0A7I7SJ02_9MYCO|nr:hypothetical protein [Mycolicibacillus koreensis]MCV7247223.1 hypothetical protein [Mycolicibacillus koreensis]OSC34253.1 hypothetical protein B8W67_07910 [Mycolicibacillus koreensis]BBY56411.1 hypothetical protein MKOR_36620 [Mycolicibacillus koreensis]
MTVRPDNRLGDTPMVPVSCASCGATVTVRKSSWQQTSVQWDADARRACRFPDGDPGEAADPARLWPGVTLASCPRLRESIDDAVRSGRLPIVDGR